MGKDISSSTTEAAIPASTNVVTIILYSSMAIVILLILIACAIMIYRRRKHKLILSQSVETGTATVTNRSKADEVKQIQTEMQRQHLKQQNTDIEEIVKIQASKKTRRKP